MNIPDSDFFKEILSIFRVEAEEHLTSMTSGLKQLENGTSMSDQKKIMENVHRAAHSLKGAARTIGLTDVEPICQSLESTFGRFMRENLSITNELIELLKKAIHYLGQLLSSMSDNGKVEGEKSELLRLIDEINHQVALMGE